jgi:hypothetical protein
MKVVETTLFGFGTAGIFFILPYLFETCKVEDGDMHEDY